MGNKTFKPPPPKKKKSTKVADPVPDKVLFPRECTHCIHS